MLKIGSHVGMSGKEMFLGSAKEAVSYGANTFMVYTGAPQNTKRKDISELRIEEGWNYMREHGIDEIVIHAPYIINMANTIKPETFELAVDFMNLELSRAEAMGSRILIVHPGAHVGAGAEAGIAKIAEALNAVLNQRSSDVLTANNWNVCQYAVLLHMLAQVCDMKAGELVHMIADAHIYDRHIPMVEELISREPLPAPKFWLNPDIKDFYQFTRDDVALIDYETHEQIKNIPVAV